MESELVGDTNGSLEDKQAHPVGLDGSEPSVAASSSLINSEHGGLDVPTQPEGADEDGADDEGEEEAEYPELHDLTNLARFVTYEHQGTFNPAAFVECCSERSASSANDNEDDKNPFQEPTLRLLPHVGIWICDMCYESTDATKMRRCQACRANSCYDCFCRWLQHRITDGHSADLSCHRCSMSISPDEVRAFCGRVTYRRHLYYLSKLEQRDNPRAAWCPKQGCWKLLLNEPRIRPNTLRCRDCSTDLCSYCLLYAHDGSNCPTPRMDLGNRLLFTVWRSLHTKKCPRCGIRIERAGGCRQMQCTGCQTRFCWRCRGLLQIVLRGPGEPRLYLCVCARVSSMFVAVSLVGGAVLIAPVTIAAAVIVGPPVLVAYATMTREQRERKRKTITACWGRM